MGMLGGQVRFFALPVENSAQRQRSRPAPQRRKRRAREQAAPPGCSGPAAAGSGWQVRLWQWGRQPRSQQQRCLPFAVEQSGHRAVSVARLPGAGQQAAAAELASVGVPPLQLQPPQPRLLGRCRQRALRPAQQLEVRGCGCGGQPPRAAQRSAVRAEVSTSRDSRLLRNPPASLKSEGTEMRPDSWRSYTGTNLRRSSPV